MKQFRYCTRISLSHSLYATISIRQKNKPISLIICNNFILIRQKNKPISLIICNNFIYTADTTQKFYIILYFLYIPTTNIVIRYTHYYTAAFWFISKLTAAKIDYFIYFKI